MPLLLPTLLPPLASLPVRGLGRGPVQSPVRTPVPPRGSVVLRLVRRTLRDGLPIRPLDVDSPLFAFVTLRDLPESGDVLVRPPIVTSVGTLDSVLWARPGVVYPRSYGETLRILVLLPDDSWPRRLTFRLAFRRGARAVVAERIGETPYYTPRPSGLRRGTGGYLTPSHVVASARYPRRLAPALDRSKTAVLFRFGPTRIFSASLVPTPSESPHPGRAEPPDAEVDRDPPGVRASHRDHPRDHPRDQPRDQPSDHPARRL